MNAFIPGLYSTDAGTEAVMPFYTKAIMEGGIGFPLYPILLHFLSRFCLFLGQCCLNTFRIIMGVVALNEHIQVNHGLEDTLFCYTLLRVMPQQKFYLNERASFCSWISSSRWLIACLLIINLLFFAGVSDAKSAPPPRNLVNLIDIIIVWGYLGNGFG